MTTAEIKEPNAASYTCKCGGVYRLEQISNSNYKTSLIKGRARIEACPKCLGGRNVFIFELQHGYASKSSLK